MDRRQAEAEIPRAWNHLIDPMLTAHAQPTGLNKGTLFVTIDSSVWRDEIVRYRRKEILDQLQHAFGRDLNARISYRLGWCWVMSSLSLGEKLGTKGKGPRAPRDDKF